MICERCGEEVYFLFGRDIDGEHYLLCWDCIVLLKEKEE
jgi:DNA-directed RNA polymerase subunit RPC12/RpoP